MFKSTVAMKMQETPITESSCQRRTGDKGKNTLFQLLLHVATCTCALEAWT